MVQSHTGIVSQNANMLILALEGIQNGSLLIRVICMLPAWHAFKSGSANLFLAIMSDDQLEPYEELVLSVKRRRERRKGS